MKKACISVLIVLLLFSTGCKKEDTAAINLAINKHPVEANFGRGRLKSLPVYDPQKANGEGWQVDLRGYDLSELKIKDRYNDLAHADFDSVTKWPSELPENYDTEKIMELGKNPGLGIRELHKEGITGKGIGIAIIDQALLVDHVEYKDNLKYYDEIHWRSSEAQMHGPAVASIAVGKNVGVAPGADLYYVAEEHGDYKNGEFIWDFTYLAQSIDRILEINKQLPENSKIRVISISIGWDKSQKGYKEVTDAVNRAKKQGMLVVSSSIYETFGFDFNGLGRQIYSDPELTSSYELGSWWADRFYSNEGGMQNRKALYVPMDSRATASPTGVNDYVFYSQGGWSWSIPYIAGLYALACQVKPEITPKEFWDTAISTGDPAKINHDGKEYKLENVVNPQRLINELKK